MLQGSSSGMKYEVDFLVYLLQKPFFIRYHLGCCRDPLLRSALLYIAVFLKAALCSTNFLSSQEVYHDLATSFPLFCPASSHL